MGRELRTSDLALATTLTARGFDPIRLEMKGEDAAEWIFNGDASVLRITRQYEAGNCQVEPRSYNLILRRTRRQLFEFLTEHGVKPRPSVK